MRSISIEIDVNKQNYRLWGKETQKVLQQSQLHAVRCTVWCGIITHKVIDPYFFDDDDKGAEMVNGVIY